ncbi:Uncharacterised protein [Burkholderia pseudomallei]|nr:Uncharacterised protein [Burkholderia pseudomallei]
MTFATQAYSSRLMKAVAEALRVPLSVPLTAGDVVYSLPAEDSPDIDNVPLQITYGRSPNLSIKETFEVMSRKVERAKKRDRASNGQYSSLRGSAMSGSTPAWSEGWAEAQNDRIPSSYIRYKLILNVGDEPVGYCSFGINMVQYQKCPLDFEIEVFEVFIEPMHRTQRLSRHFAVVIVQFTLNALYELCERLNKLKVKDSYGLTLRIAAEIESRSGARFLQTIEQAFAKRREFATSWEAQFEDFSWMLCPGDWCTHGPLPFFIMGYEVDARW